MGILIQTTTVTDLANQSLSMATQGFRHLLKGMSLMSPLLDPRGHWHHDYKLQDWVAIKVPARSTTSLL